MIQTCAIWFPAPRRVELREELAPPPGPGQIRVCALASAISHGTERLVFRGEVPSDLPLDLPTLAGGYGFPIKFGYASVGLVESVGPAVAGLAVGDQVFCLHPHQGCYTIPSALAQPLPAGLDPVLGLFCANLETALNIVHDAHPRLGEAALVFGQGVVGLLVSQLLQRAGVRVFAVEPDPARQRLALDLGAAAAFAPGPELGERLRAHNGQRMADLAVEVSGAPAALQAAIDHVLDEGTVVVASWYGQKPVPLALGGHFHRGRLRLRSSQVGRLAPESAPRWDYARRWEAVRALLPQLRLDDLISHRFTLGQAEAAYRLLDTGGAGLTQIIFTYDSQARRDGAQSG